MTKNGAQRDSAEAPGHNTPFRWPIPLTVAFAFLMEELDSTVLTTAIPQMARDLDTTVLHLSLAVTAYVLTLAIFIPVSGWFADRFGARRIFALSLLVFTTSSVICGMAETLEQLVAARCIQGLGGAMMTPVGRLILLRSFPKNQLIRAMLYMTFPAMIGPIVGPLLGGFLTTYLSWRWIFYINVPFGLVGIALALKLKEEARAEGPAKFDLLGFVLAGAGLSLLQFGMQNVGYPVLSPAATAVMLVLGTVLLATFAYHALNHPAPVIDPSLFKLRTFRIGTLAGGLCRIGINGVPFLLPLMLEVGLGLTPLQSGSITFVTALGSVVIRPLSVRLLKLLGFDRMLIASGLLGAALIAGFSLIGPGVRHWVIAVYVATFGLARSAQFLSSNTLSYSEMPSQKLSNATNLGGVIQHLSVSLGVMIGALLLGLVKGQQEALTLADFHQAFLLMAVIPVVAVPGFLLLHPEDGTGVSGHSRRRRRHGSE